MIEAARIQAAIEIVDQVARSLDNDGPSADVLIRKYFRTRRYAGSKDRRAVTDLVYRIIRNWGFLHDSAAGDSRRMMLLTLKDTAAFTGQDHAPAEVTEAEQQFLSAHHEQKPCHLLNYPAWLENRLRDRFGEDFAAELEQLNGRAPFDLRVNLGKAGISAVEAVLKADGMDYHPGKWAKTALVLVDNPRIEGWDIYKNGLVEIQDEAAQLAVELCDIKPGQQVMDLCAGAGGKTLAAAAYMENHGQIYAYDNNARRLRDLKPRAKRANARIIQGRHLDTAGGKRQKILSVHIDYKGGASDASGGNSSRSGSDGSSPHQIKKGRMDRVMLDVPCSGSGVWRRNPELKWRLDAEKLAQYCRIQQNLLIEGWQFVKQGGRLIYMTCSLFDDENEGQVTAFLKTTENARLVPYTDIYRQGGLKTLSSLPECLALSPASHGTDGFFIAILEKVA